MTLVVSLNYIKKALIILKVFFPEMIENENPTIQNPTPGLPRY
jgi:hypothetical protein